MHFSEGQDVKLKKITALEAPCVRVRVRVRVCVCVCVRVYKRL